LIYRKWMKQAKLTSVLRTLLIFFFSFFKGYSIGNETQIGAGEVSMGNASVTLISPLALFHNQAALARIKSVSRALDYRKPYLIAGYSKQTLAIGLPIFNPSSPNIESLNLSSRLPFRANFGIGLRLSDQLLITSELRYCSINPVNLGAGIEYKLTDRFFLPCSVSGKPVRHSLGPGFKQKSFEIDFALLHHESLGYTPSISLILNII